VHKILTFIKRLTDFCLQSLHHRFVAWTKPDTTSLLLGTLIDLARSKSELVAENALLRQQLIVLRRQVKRPACTKTDRMLLVLLARMVRTWRQAHITRSARDVTAVALPGFSALLEVQIQSSCSQIKDNRRDRGQHLRKWPETTDCGEQSGFVANCSSWVYASANAPFRNICDRCAQLDHVGRPGRPSYARMPSRSGPATSSLSRISSSTRCSPSSSSNCTRAK
jgi:hypothetical protein